MEVSNRCKLIRIFWFCGLDVICNILISPSVVSPIYNLTYRQLASITLYFNFDSCHNILWCLHFACVSCVSTRRYFLYHPIRMQIHFRAIRMKQRIIQSWMYIFSYSIFDGRNKASQRCEAVSHYLAEEFWGEGTNINEKLSCNWVQ